MRKSILLIALLTGMLQLSAQNLVVNADAESLPRGTGWTVIREGAITCLLVPTNNMINWTMKPDGSYNYPFDHTTGAAGGTVFFSGCDTYLQGPFELQQTIDVSADAATIDAGIQPYTFSGYLQTPVTDQTDRGRYIVDFLDASNNILGTSYTSTWQSNFEESGIGWVLHTNTRTAPAYTRKVIVRLQAQLYINQPAINAYFDDISLIKTSIVPLRLLSFTGTETNSNIDLKWQMADVIDCKEFELQRSADATNFNKIVTITAGKTNYEFIDENINPGTGKYFYRLKIKSTDGKITYSNVITVKVAGVPSFTPSPNPANNTVMLNGLSQPGTVSIINYNGSTLLTAAAGNQSLLLDIAKLPAGLYIVRYSYLNNSINKKLIIQHR